MTEASSGIPEHFSRVPALDGLRTLAVLLVFTFHARPDWAKGGNIGVDIFFTISGFVITLLLLPEVRRTGRVVLRWFYLGRLARLWPALLVLSIIVLVASATAPGLFLAGAETRSVIAAVSYVMNFARGLHVGGIPDSTALGHTWSLAVEEQFYLVWPLVLVLLIRLGGLRRATVATFALALLPTVVRLLVWQGGTGVNRIYNLPDTRADQLLIGCGLAMLYSSSTPRIEKLGRVLYFAIWPAILCLACFALFVDQEAFLSGVVGTINWTVGLLLLAIVAGILIAGLAWNPNHHLSRLLGSKWIAWPGRTLSYGFYLWHFPVLLVMIPLGVEPIPRIVGGFLLTLIVSLISSRYIEMPIRHRFARARARAVRAHAPG